MEGDGEGGVGAKKVYLMSKISEYFLHVVLLLIKYLCLYGQEKSVHININSGSFARLLRLLCCRIPMTLTAKVFSLRTL